MAGNLSRTSKFVCLLLVLSSLPFSAKALDLDLWVSSREQLAIEKLMANISPEGTRRGIVIASPTPLYFKHWIRDSAIVMDIVISLYEKAATAGEKQHYFSILSDFVELSKEVQDKLINQLGEALVFADGSVPHGVLWGVPQHDGPALRAITLNRWANILLREGKEDYVRRWLYESKIPADTVIKADAEHTLHAKGSSYDPWEEERGDIFYVKMVQRKALLETAKLADRLGDGGAAKSYRDRARELEAELVGDETTGARGFWDPVSKRLICIKNYEEGIPLDKAGLDSSIILGVMHGDTHDGFLSVGDDRVLSTAIQLELTFKELYLVNQDGTPGILMGRNRSDVWDGSSRSGEGHPWVLITYAFSEYYSRVAGELSRRQSISINETNALFFRSLLQPQHHVVTVGTDVRRGTPLFAQIIKALGKKSDSFLERLAAHSNAQDGDGFNELVNRTTGRQQGVANLTWSCASAILASWERSQRPTRKKRAA